jgi:hypothetical protein
VGSDVTTDCPLPPAFIPYNQAIQCDVSKLHGYECRQFILSKFVSFLRKFPKSKIKRNIPCNLISGHFWINEFKDKEY